MTIAAAPRCIRLQAGGSAAGAHVDREARLVRGVSVIRRGEALGHQLWIDEQFLDELVAAGDGRRIKAHLGHPQLSSDALPMRIGWVRDLRRARSHVRGDLELFERANAQEVARVEALIEEDPGNFGLSIVYEPDSDAEAAFVAAHTDERTGAFRSPDRANKKNLPHARLAALRSIDVVDEPAANPDGLFSFAQGGELAAIATAYVEYALGLREALPEGWTGAPHPERAKRFVAELLARRGLALLPIDAARSSRDERLDALERELHRQTSWLRRKLADILITGGRTR